MRRLILSAALLAVSATAHPGEVCRFEQCNKEQQGALLKAEAKLLDALNDPDSYKRSVLALGMTPKGFLEGCIVFRARNGMGGMIKAQAIVGDSDVVMVSTDRLWRDMWPDIWERTCGTAQSTEAPATGTSGGGSGFVMKSPDAPSQQPPQQSAALSGQWYAIATVLSANGIEIYREVVQPPHSSQEACQGKIGENYKKGLARVHERFGDDTTLRVECAQQ
jgi:hypothetical protein